MGSKEGPEVIGQQGGEHLELRGATSAVSHMLVPRRRREMLSPEERPRVLEGVLTARAVGVGEGAMGRMGVGGPGGGIQQHR